ncbi:hypothetical protein ACFVVA_33905 [Kitasatospora sp. NPDC058048]|uniref:hypothetical protein n=1 Tax=Kitasatospora sp. NPDC058048 TaxID=3346313 RepID=UPI0036DA9D59
MGPYHATPVPPPPALHPCPNCGLTDQVRGVPAVYHAGRTRVTTRPSQGSGDHRTREVVSDLARALAPVPIRDQQPGRTATVLGAVALVIAFFTFFAGNFARQFDDDAPAFAAPVRDHHAFEIPVVIPVVAVIAGTVLLVTAAALRASADRELAGRPRAEHLWAQAWYCARCGTVHFPPTTGVPTGVPTAALSLPEFRRVVWTAGGYGHLADRY